MIITDPLFYAVAIPAVILTGLAKGGFMNMLAMLAVPLMALVISPVQAAGIMLPLLICMDVTALWAYWRVYDLANLKVLVPAAVLGVGIGWATASYVSEAHVRLIVGLVAFVFCLDHYFGLRQRAEKHKPNPAMGRFWGMVAGFTSFVSHAGGPPMQMYLLPQRLEPRLFAGTSVIFFTVVNWVKVIPYAALGQLGLDNLATSAALAPIAPLAIMAGAKLTRIVKPETYYGLAYLAILIVSLKLIWDGGRAVLGL